MAYHLIPSQGSWPSKQEDKTAAFTAETGILYKIDPTAGAMAVTIPLAVTVPRKVISFKNQTDLTTAITITASGSDTIDGASTYVMNIGRQGITIQSDAVSDWVIV